MQCKLQPRSSDVQFQTTAGTWITGVAQPAASFRGDYGQNCNDSGWILGNHGGPGAATWVVPAGTDWNGQVRIYHVFSGTRGATWNPAPARSVPTAQARWCG